MDETIYFLQRSGSQKTNRQTRTIFCVHHMTLSPPAPPIPDTYSGLYYLFRLNLCKYVVWLILFFYLVIHFDQKYFVFGLIIFRLGAPRC